MSEIIVKLAYIFEASKKYFAVKNFLYELLEDNHSEKKKYFDFIMIFLVLSTVGVMVFEVNHKSIQWLRTYENVAIFIFIAEWLSRFWITTHMHKQIIKDYEKSQLLNTNFNLRSTLSTIIKDKLRFVFSLMSIIDLLAILPYYRPLRILRILMLFRLFKLFRYANSIKQLGDVFFEKRFEFFTLSIILMMAIVFGSTIIFIFEGANVNPNIHSFFDTIYWSVITISTVGYGDISPVTTEGRVATLFLVIVGLSLISFFTSIITTALSARLVVIKEEKVIGEANALKDFIIICGYGRMGKILADELIKIKHKFIVVDHMGEMLSHTSSQNILSIKGDATDSEFLKSIGVNKGASSVIALTNNDAINLSIILTVRAQNPNINIISRAENYKAKQKLLLAGANEVIYANEVSSLVAAEYIGQPIAFEAIDDILLNNEGSVMDEVEIVDKSYYVGYKLENINFSKFNLTLIGIMKVGKNAKFKFNPRKDQYIICKQDILILIGHKESILKFRVDLLSSKPKKS